MKKLLLSTLLLANGVTVAAPFVVKDIRIDGVAPEMQPAIISTLPVKVGQTATDSDVANVVRQLFIQNRFDNVRAEREGNTLVIRVSERPIIANVEIEGNQAIPKDPLEQNLKANLITKGEEYNPEKLAEFKKALVDHYHSMGRQNATVESEVTPNSAGQMNIKLKINENEVSYVKQIAFEGNKAFSSEELLDQLEIQPDVSWWNIFSSSKYEAEAFNKDREALRNFYLNRGYAKFQLEEPNVQFSDDKKDVFITYRINEGDQYKLSEVRIIGNTENLDKELNELIQDFKVGELFRGEDLFKAEESLRSRLGDHGYGAAKVELYPTFNDAEHTVRISFLVDVGKRLYVRNIRFEGNDVTADSTLRREMRQQEGSWLSTNLVALGKTRLERTGFYETVEMQTVAVPDRDDQVDVVYKIKERNTGSINFGIGYGTESGISYQAGIKQDNFLGMGSTISLSGERNDYGTGINLGYNEPYFTKDGVSLGGNIFYQDYNNYKNKSAAKYARTTYGVSGNLGFPVDENNSYYLGLGYVHNTIKNSQREIYREKYVKSMNIDIDNTLNVYPRIKTDDFEFSLGWNYNSLNRGYLPTQGTIANINGKVTIPGSDNKYYKVSADFANYIPLNREHKWVVLTRASVGYASGYGGKELPFFQTYTAGGIGSLRGFAGGAVGPKAVYLNNQGKFEALSYDVIGGNAVASASLEFIMPTPFVDEKYQHNVRTSVFVDAATAWDTKASTTYQGIDKSYYKNDKKVRASAGVAFQWNSPIGPLMFSYAKPLRKYDSDEIEQFQFSIGGSF